MRGVFGHTYKHSVVPMAVVVGDSPKALVSRLLPKAVDHCPKQQPWEAEQPEWLRSGGHLQCARSILLATHIHSLFHIFLSDIYWCFIYRLPYLHIEHS